MFIILFFTLCYICMWITGQELGETPTVMCKETINIKQ
jgi:hypothetical protein